MSPKSRRLLCCTLLSLLVVAACSSDPQDKARKHRERGDVFLSEERFGEAQVEYRAALQRWPRDTAALFGLSQVFAATGEPGQERSTLRKILTIEPNHPDATLKLAALALASGNYSATLELTRRTLSATPDSLPAKTLEARALGSMGEEEQARNVWKSILAAADHLPGHVMEAADLEADNGEWEAAVSLLEEGVRRFPDAAELLVAVSHTLARKGDREAALAVLDRLDEGNVATPRTVAAQARLLVRLGETEGARQRFEDGLASFADQPLAQAQLAVEYARTLAGLGDLTAARATLVKARDNSPRHTGLQATLADVLIILGEIDRAKALIPVPGATNRDNLLLEARLNLAEGRHLRALAITEAVLAKGDLAVDTRLLHATALAENQRWGAARREYEIVLKRLPYNIPARLGLVRSLGALGLVEPGLHLLKGLPPPLQQTGKVQFLEAELRLASGDLEGARGIVLNLLRDHADKPRIWILKGDIERARHWPKSAFKAYDKARELDPTNLRSLLARSDLLFERGAETRVIVAGIEDWQATYGDDPRALNWMAQLHWKRGDPVSALRALDRSLLNESNYYETHLLRARVLWEEGEKAKAVLAYRETIKVNPLHPDAYNELARIHLLDGAEDKAEETYKRLLDLYPGEPQTSNNLAYLYLQQGKAKEALALAHDAYRGSPKNPGVLDTVGWALESVGRSEDAEGYLEEAEAALEENPEFLFHRVVNWKSLGKTEKARQALRRIVRLVPDSQVARKAREQLQPE